MNPCAMDPSLSHTSPPQVRSQVLESSGASLETPFDSIMTVPMASPPSKHGHLDPETTLPAVDVTVPTLKMRKTGPKGSLKVWQSTPQGGGTKQAHRCHVSMAKNQGLVALGSSFFLPLTTMESTKGEGYPLGCQGAW